MPKGFEASDGWTNGNMFNVNWHKENVTFDNGNLQLVIDNEKIRAKSLIPAVNSAVRAFTDTDAMKSA